MLSLYMSYSFYMLSLYMSYFAALYTKTLHSIYSICMRYGCLVYNFFFLLLATERVCHPYILNFSIFHLIPFWHCMKLYNNIKYDFLKDKKVKYPTFIYLPFSLFHIDALSYTIICILYIFVWNFVCYYICHGFFLVIFDSYYKFICDET